MKKVTFLGTALCVLSINYANALPIEGSSSGIFVNNVNGVVEGLGTNSFYWGTETDRSHLIFTGNSFVTETENLFSFGTLGYYNGAIPSGTGADAVDLSVDLTLTIPDADESFNFTLGLINTLNTTDPNASADYVQFNNLFPTSTFSLDGVDYTLELFGFGTLTGAGFTSIDGFHVLENSSASAELIGRVTANIPSSVPEPASMSLLLCGVLSLGGLCLKKKFK
jgi:hypothetical protein